MKPIPATSSSTFAPLRVSAFRTLWLVWLAANLVMWMNDIACAWLMTSLTDSAVMVAMVQAASTFPLFVLGLPSGALADLFDHRRYLAFTQVWMCAVALVLALLAVTGTLSAPILLAGGVLNGIGMAMRWPLFAAMLPGLVSRAQLPAALALNGIAANLSRLIGPIIAGVLLGGAGGALVFLLNGAINAAMLICILRWRAAPAPRAAPGEALFAAMRSGLRYVLGAPQLRLILLRIFLFFLQSAALSALLPLIAARLHGNSPAAYTLLLVALATGALLVAFNLNRLRRLASCNRLVGAGIVLHALASVSAVAAPTMLMAALAVAVAGMAWIITANCLTVAMQLGLPDWVRARGMAIYLMAVMGGSALGAALFGYVADMSSVPVSVMAAAMLGTTLLLLTRRWRVTADAVGASMASSTSLFIDRR